MNGNSASRGRRAFAMTLVAFIYAAALVPAGLVVPVYRGLSRSASGATRTFSATLVEENGGSVLLVLAVPALLAGLVWVALHWRCSRGGARSGLLAWFLVGVVAVFAVLGAATIGMFVMPVAALLAAATAATPRGPAG